MTVSVYSLIMSLICSSLVFWIGIILATYGKRVRLKLILLIYMLGAARLFLPVEFRNGKVVMEFNIYPMLRRIGRKELIGGITVTAFLIMIWAGVSILLLLCFLKELSKLKKIVADAGTVLGDGKLYEACQKAAGQLGYTGEFTIAVTKDFSTPVSVSFLKPVILVPEQMLAFPETEFVGFFKHELIHFLRKDVGKQRAVKLLQCLFWWNPVVYFLKICTEQMIELQCDTRVCRDMLEEEKVAYLDSILHVLKLGNKKEPELGIGYAKSAFLKRRFEEVLEPPKKQSGGLTMLLAVISVALFLVSYMFLVQPAGTPGEKGFLNNGEAIDEEYVSDFLIKYPDGTYVYTKDMVRRNVLTEDEIKQPPYAGLPIYESE